MMICSCAAVSSRDVERAIDWMRASDPHIVITPGRIYRALGKTPECGGCIKLFVENMRGSPNFSVPTQLHASSRATKEDKHEGRPKGHRLSQQGAAQ